MTVPIPATGTQVQMGGVYAAYTAPGTKPAAGTSVELNAELAVKSAAFHNPPLPTPGLGQPTTLSQTFGGRQGPFDYI